MQKTADAIRFAQARLFRLARLDIRMTVPEKCKAENNGGRYLALDLADVGCLDEDALGFQLFDVVTA